MRLPVYRLEAWKRLLVLALVGATYGVYLSACETTEGLGRDVENLGDEIEDAADDADDDLD